MSAPGSAFAFAKACKSRHHVRCIQPSAFARNIPCDCGNFSGAFRPVRTIGRAQTWDAVTASWAAGMRAAAEYVMPACHRSYVLEEHAAGEVEQ
jgi:hypothetical protein